MGNVAFGLGAVFAALGALLIVAAFFKRPPTAGALAAPAQPSSILDVIKAIIDFLTTMAKDNFLKVFVPGVILLVVGVGLMFWGATLNKPDAVGAAAIVLVR